MGQRKVRGVQVARADIIERFTPLIGATVTYSRFLSYIQRCASSRGLPCLGDSTLKEIWLGKPKDNSSLELLARLTGVDFRKSREEDAVGRRLDRIREFLPILSTRLFAASEKTSRIKGALSQLETDVLAVQRQAETLATDERIELASATCQVAGCMQMFAHNPDESRLRGLWRVANNLAASIELDDESLANKLRGILHWNWIGPQWHQWCHPQAELTENDVAKWLDRFDLADSFFSMSAENDVSPEHGALTVSAFRTIVSGPNPGCQRAERLKSEIFEEISNPTNRAYALVVSSHRDFKLNHTMKAIDEMAESRDLYESELGSKHRFVSECELRLCELGAPVQEPMVSLLNSRESGVPNSCIVDLDRVEKIFKKTRGKKSEFLASLKQPMSN